jgi:hypothetical protein
MERVKHVIAWAFVAFVILLSIASRTAGIQPSARAITPTVFVYKPYIVLQSTPTPTNTPTPTPTNTPTPTYTPSRTPTRTTTSNPAPPTLIAPDDAVLLPQPVSPEQWVFTWNSCGVPRYCWSTLYVYGPAGQRLTNYGSDGQSRRFVYTSTYYLPLDALGRWTWFVIAYKNYGQSRSETRTFWVAKPPGTRQLFLALILKDD